MYKIRYKSKSKCYVKIVFGDTKSEFIKMLPNFKIYFKKYNSYIY